MTVLDVSNYDATTFDPACMKAAGVTGVIIGCQRENLAWDMCVDAKAAELPVEGVYAFLYFGLDTLGQTQAAIRIALQFQVPIVWLDCESTGEHDNASGPSQRITELTNCIEAVQRAGLDVGIYTGRWWWPSYMGNTTVFSGLPLWHSEYGVGSAPAAPVRVVDYGGWAGVAIHQYTSQFWCCGRNRDANYVFMEDDMTEDRVREIIREELGWGQAPPETTLAGLNRWGNKLEAEQVVPWISALKLHMATPHTSGPVPPHPHAVTVTLD